MPNPTIQIAITYDPATGVAISNVSRDLNKVADSVEAASRRLSKSWAESMARNNAFRDEANSLLAMQQRYVQSRTAIVTSSETLINSIVSRGIAARGVLFAQELRNYQNLITQQIQTSARLASAAGGGGYYPPGQAALPGPGGFAPVPFYNVARPIPGTGGAHPPPPGGGGGGYFPPGTPLGGGGGADFLRGTLGVLGETMTNLQRFALILARVGLHGLIAEITVGIGVTAKLAQQFIKVNEEFANFEITLGAILQNATQARAVRSEVAQITARSPLPFEGIAELVKSLALIPALRGQFISQTKSGNLSDPEGFLNKNIHLVEQMLAFRPDKKVADAVFSLREALSGEFRSLVRRFDIPLSTITAISGVPASELKKSPEKTLKAIQDLFNQIIDPSSIAESVKQPSKLFQNILEQAFLIPLLSLGDQVVHGGKSLYNSILQPFQDFLAAATKFGSAGGFTGIGPLSDITSSPLTQFAEQAAKPIFSMFQKALTFLEESVDHILGKAGIGKDRPNQSIFERVAGLIVRSLEGLDKNFVPLLERGRKVLTDLFTILQTLVNTVIGFLDKFGNFIGEHPLLSVTALAALRPATSAIIGGIGNRLIDAGTAGYASRSAAGVGAGIAGGIAASVASLAPIAIGLLGAAGVAAAIYTVVDRYTTAKSRSEANTAYIQRSVTDVSAGAVSPDEKISLLEKFNQTETLRRKAESEVFKKFPDFKFLKENNLYSLTQRANELTKQLEDFGISSSQLAGDGAVQLIEGLKKSGAMFLEANTVSQRNANVLTKLAAEGQLSFDPFRRGLAVEQEFPVLSGFSEGKTIFDKYKGISSEAVSTQSKKLEDVIHPLDSSYRVLRDLAEVKKEVAVYLDRTDSIFANPDQLEKEVATGRQRIEGILSNLAAHPTLELLDIDGVTKTYEEWGSFYKEMLAKYTPDARGVSPIETEKRIQTLREAFTVQETGLHKLVDETAAATLELKDYFEKFGGTAEQGKKTIVEFVKNIRNTGLLSDDSLKGIESRLSSAIAYEGDDTETQNRSRKIAGEVFLSLLEALKMGMLKLEKGWLAEINAKIGEAGGLHLGQSYFDASGRFHLTNRSDFVTAPEGSNFLDNAIEKGKIDKAVAARNAANKGFDMAEFLRNRATDFTANFMDKLLESQGPNQSELLIQRFAQNRGLAGIPSNLSYNQGLFRIDTTRMGEAGDDIRVAKLQEAIRYTTLLQKALEAEAASTRLNSQAKSKLIKDIDELRTSTARFKDELALMQKGGIVSSFFEGLGEAISISVVRMQDLSDAGKELGTALRTNLGNAFYEFITSTKSAGQAFSDFGNTILQTAAKIASQKSANALLGLLFNVAGSIVGSAIGGSTGLVVQSAISGVGSSGVVTTGGESGRFGGGYATGGSIMGPSHAQGGVTINAEGGEFMIRKDRVRSEGIEKLAALNEGRATIVRRYDLGGQISPNSGPGTFDRGSNIYGLPSSSVASAGPVVQVNWTGNEHAPYWNQPARTTPVSTPSSSGSRGYTPAGGITISGSQPGGGIDRFGRDSGTGNWIAGQTTKYFIAGGGYPGLPNYTATTTDAGHTIFYGGSHGHIEDGVVVPTRAPRGIRGLAEGGQVTGGSGIKDDVPILGMDGEWMIKREAAKYYGDRWMRALNEKRIKKMASGGAVGTGVYEGGAHDRGGHIIIPINITVPYSSGESTGDNTNRREAAEKLGPMMEAACKEVLVNEMRPGGLLYRS